MNIGKQFKEGLITQNPVTVQLLGMCSTMAITTTMFNGIGMGISVLIILTCSNIAIAMLRKAIPAKIRIAAYVVVIAGFVTMVDLLIQAFVPALSESLGVFIPLIVVNCIILGRAEAFASKNTVIASTFDGIFQGIGYTVILCIMCLVREIIGNGTFFEYRILPESYPGCLLLVLPFGGFLVLGCVIAFMQWALKKSEDNKLKEGAK